MTVYAMDNGREMFMASPKTMVVSPSPKHPRITVGALLNPTWPELTPVYDDSPPPPPQEHSPARRLSNVSSNTRTGTGCFNCGALFQCQSLLKSAPSPSPLSPLF